MLKVMRKDGRTVPLACCDVCGSWIDDAELAAAVFAHIGPEEGDTQEVQVVHKGACHDKAEAQLQATGTGVGWLELKHFLADMLYNSGLPIAALQEIQADEEKFGRL